MKVLVVLVICLHIATCLIPSFTDKETQHEKYCCGMGYQDISASGTNSTCVTLNQLVLNRTRETLRATDRLEHYLERRERRTPEFELQTLIHEFSQAASKCIPNNRVYRNVHVVLDDLHSLIERLPMPKTVQKRIAEAQDYMDEHFDDLHRVQSKSPDLRNRIDEFSKEYSRKAAEVFERNRSHARDASRIFRDGRLYHVTRDIIGQVDDCLGVERSDSKLIFKCREQVRSLVSDISRMVKDVLRRRKDKSVPHRHSIDKLLMDFAAEKREIEDLKRGEEMERKFKHNHRD